jgi:hypothetical protein
MGGDGDERETSMMRLGILCLSAVCCLAGCGTTTVVKEIEPVQVPMQTVVEQVVEAVPEVVINETDVEMLAKLVWGEARGCTTTEQAAVIWTVLNRVDSEDPVFPDTIQEVVTQPWQFIGYDPNHPVEQDKVDLARDVLTRWLTGGEGRVLPKEYVFFHGDGIHNHFRIEYQHNGQYWDWSLDSPYEKRETEYITEDI